MNKLKILFVVVALLYQLCCVLSAYGQDKSVALVARSSGPVTLLRSDQESKLKKRAQVFVGDQIVTGNDAWVTLNFYDLTRVVLRPNSSFIIHKFPQTMGASDVTLELNRGGARLISGTNSTGANEYFTLITPEGDIQSSRSEWVVRICSDDECEQLQQSFSRCSNYVNPDLESKQLVSVYKGTVQLDYCPLNNALKVGMTASSGENSNTCETIDYVPCVILSDGSLGKDKLRTLLPLLIRLPSTKRRSAIRPTRPQRPPPRPRNNRPPR